MICGFAAIGLPLLPALAQSPDDVQAMQRVIEAQSQQIEAQQQQLDSLRETLESQSKVLQELEAQLDSPTEEPGKPEPAVVADAPTPSPDADATVTREGPPVADWDRYETETPTNSNVTYFGPARKGMVPSDADVAVHGLLEFQIIHDTVGLNNNRFDTATIPIDGGPSQTKFNVNPSQLAASSITPVSSGTLNTWLSFDLNGQIDSPEPRLRIAFAEYVSNDSSWALLGGQTYSTMLDMRAVPESLDFALPAGLWQLRHPLIRYTKALSQTVTGEFSAETPENVSYTGADKRTRWPDFSAAGTWFVDGDYIKHFRISALTRDLIAEDVDGASDSELGWAISGSTKVALPFLDARDNLKVTVHFGDGYGTTLKGGPKEGVFNPNTSQLETIGIVGTFGALQHFWSDKFRSNLTFGYVDADNPDFVPSDTFKSTSYLGLNFVWNPFPTTKLGIEYLWGERENEDGSTGDANRFILSSMITF